MTITDDKLRENLETIRSRSKNAKVIAVTKYVELEDLQRLYNLGQTRFAENRPQNFLEKYEAMADQAGDIEWHYIGRLQRRPVKDIINKIDYLHSLDRMSLAIEVDKRADHQISCFLQVNVAGEEQKAGFAVDEVEQAIADLADYPNILIVGLMTMAPYEASDQELELIFSTLADLQKKIESKHLDYAPCHELSMGMSRDYPLAVDHGASYVRVGTAFFRED